MTRRSDGGPVGARHSQEVMQARGPAEIALARLPDDAIDRRIQGATLLTALDYRGSVLEPVRSTC
jgi:hypothetical protein